MGFRFPPFEFRFCFLMLAPAEAEKLIQGAIRVAEVEDCPIADAHGRVLRAAIGADRDLPPFDRATMDGYALRSASVTAGISEFDVGGVQAAGHAPGALGPSPGSCIEIMTGAPLPEGADCVVPYEETTRLGATMRLVAGRPLPAGNAVHRRGTDRRAGEIIVPEGTRLGGREIAVAAACGRPRLCVSRRPTIAVVATGDELVEIDAAPEPHQIRRSNDTALRAALAQAGYPGADRHRVPDVQPEMEDLLRRLLGDYDVVILTGGVSKGKFDLLPAELERQRVRRIFHGVAQRPGKPLWFGVGARMQLVFALPGNPVSSYTCLHRYVIPALDASAGLAPPPPRVAALSAAFRFKPKLTCFLPVALAAGPRGEPLAAPVPGNTSGDFAGLVGTDGFVELPAGDDEFPAGTLVRYWPWA